MPALPQRNPRVLSMQAAASGDTPFLSLCMIVKNESAHLSQCLASAQPWVDEMVVIDTGSTDETPEIAAQFGARVGFFEWCNDFAKARNYAISQASGRWLLVLDADEELVVQGDFLESLKTSDRLGYMLTLHDAYQPNKLIGGKYLRLFQNHPHLRYSGCYHEALRYHDQPLTSEQVGFLGDRVTIVHYGYHPDLLAQKHRDRNIPLLEAAQAETGLDLMLLFTLVQAYEMMGQQAQVDACYEAAFNQLLPNLLSGDRPEPFRTAPSWLYNLGIRLLHSEEFESLRLVCQRGLEWCPQFPPLLHLAGIALIELGFPLGSTAYFQECLRLGQTGEFYSDEPFASDLLTTQAAYNLGYAYRQLHQWPAAIAAYERALTFDPTYYPAQAAIAEIQAHLNQSTS